MTTKRVVMPQLGESVHEGTISKWLVKPGDKVVEFEPMLEVDTDKVSAEVPAPVTGILKEILAKEGQTVQAGAEIAVVEVGGDGEVAESSPPAGEVAGTAGGGKPSSPPAGEVAAAPEGGKQSSPPAGEVAQSAGGGVRSGKADSGNGSPAEATPDAPAPAKPAASSPLAGEVPPGSRSDPRGGGGVVPGKGATPKAPQADEAPSPAQTSPLAGEVAGPSPAGGDAQETSPGREPPDGRSTRTGLL